MGGRVERETERESEMATATASFPCCSRWLFVCSSLPVLSPSSLISFRLVCAPLFLGDGAEAEGEKEEEEAVERKKESNQGGSAPKKFSTYVHLEP